MNKKKLLLIGILILPWFTTPFLGVKAFKRFLPASLLTSVLVLIENYLAGKFKWWKFHEKFHPKLSGEEPFNYGPFLVSSLWTLKLTYGKLPAYLLFTSISNAVFAFILVNINSRLGIVSLRRMSNFQFYIILWIKAILLYSFQYVIEHYKKSFKRA